MRLILSALLLTASALLVSACGSESSGEETSGTEDAGDGRYHPAPNGVHTTEDAACSALGSSYEKRRQALSCTGTTRPCPDFLRTQFQTACMEYDQGSVEGCQAYYIEQKTCEKLSAALADCAVTPYPGTEPAGCP